VTRFSKLPLGAARRSARRLAALEADAQNGVGGARPPAEESGETRKGLSNEPGLVQLRQRKREGGGVRTPRDG